MHRIKKKMGNFKSIIMMKLLMFLLIISFFSYKSSKVCQKYDEFYKEEYNFLANCSGSPQGNSRDLIFAEYFGQIGNIDSSLIVIEQISYVLATDFIKNQTIFVRDFKFDKQYRYIQEGPKKDRLKDNTSEYGKKWLKTNIITTDSIVNHIKRNELKNIQNLIEENKGGVEGNTIITLFDEKLKIIDGISLKRQIQFDEIPDFDDKQ